MVTIIVADDHKVVRKGLNILLSSESDFTIIGEADNGLEAVNLVKQLRPDVLILDLMMGGINGLEVIRQLSYCSLNTAVVVLSMHSNEAYVEKALRYGARGYILKESPPEELIQAIREVISGHCFLSSLLSNYNINADTHEIDPRTTDPCKQLTPREHEVLVLTAEGKTSMEIASQLSISPRTVESHRASLMDKLNLAGRAQLIHYAVNKNLVAESSNTLK